METAEAKSECQTKVVFIHFILWVVHLFLVFLLHIALIPILFSHFITSALKKVACRLSKEEVGRRGMKEINVTTDRMSKFIFLCEAMLCPNCFHLSFQFSWDLWNKIYMLKHTFYVKLIDDWHTLLGIYICNHVSLKKLLIGDIRSSSQDTEAMSPAKLLEMSGLYNLLVGFRWHRTDPGWLFPPCFQSLC